MAGRWQVWSHPRGDWILDTGGQRWVLPGRVARWLVPLHGFRPEAGEVLKCLQKGNLEDRGSWSDDQLVRLADRLTHQGRPHPGPGRRLALWGRVPLISARWTRCLARPLWPLTSGRSLVLMLVPALVGPFLLLPAAGMAAGPVQWLLAVGLFLFGALLHELGHAAALAAQGYPPGGIGSGVLFILPVLHNDVSAVALLPTAGKLRVDLAGVVLQGGYACLLVGLAWGSGEAAGVFAIAARLTWLAMVWSLIPFIRSDGYWVVCDLLGVKDFESSPPGVLGPWKMGTLQVLRGLNLVFLLLVAVAMPWLWVRRLAPLLGRWLPPVGQGLVWIVFGMFLLWLWWGLWGRMRRLVGAFNLTNQRSSITLDVNNEAR